MAEFKGTPGPWRLYAGFVVKDVDESGDWWELATVSDQVPDAERLPNARLIAAAPDLLAAALEYIEFSCDDKSDGCPCCEAENHLHAAITRALGEPS